MCFSAGASFGAATALAAIGGLSVRGAASRSHLPLASIPLLFAAQQASEGFLWLVLDHAPFGKSDTFLVRVFLFFALFVWPAYIPAALFAIERARPRRIALAALSIGGAVFGAYLMGCASLRRSDACIAFDNLYYWVQIDPSLNHVAPFAYLVFIVGALVVSSTRGTWLLASVVVSSFAATGWLYRAGFVSVWCFFAAVLSGTVALIARRSKPVSSRPLAAMS